MRGRSRLRPRTATTPPRRPRRARPGTCASPRRGGGRRRTACRASTAWTGGALLLQSRRDRRRSSRSSRPAASCACSQPNASHDVAKSPRVVAPSVSRASARRVHRAITHVHAVPERRGRKRGSIDGWRAPIAPSSSCTGSGCTPTRGRRGSSVSAPRGTRRPRRAGPATGDVGQETRAQPEAVAGYGIDDVVDHYARIIGALGAKPIVIGHSFGGLIAQRLLGRGPRRGRGRDRPRADQGRDLPAAVRAPRRVGRAAEPGEPQARGVADGGAVPLRLRNAVSAEESKELYERWTIPSPGQPLFEAAIGEPLARTRRRRSTPATRRAGRCSSPQAARTTRSRRRSAARP